MPPLAPLPPPARARRAPPRRARGRVRPLLAALLALSLLAGPSAARALGYTVQAAALSDAARAAQLERGLEGAGFPAYVVRTATGQGDIYRVRVGSFRDRDAADLYAAAMPAVAGGRPVPALAEDIPVEVGGPLRPGVAATAPQGGDAALLPWRGGVALRRQGPGEEPAEYVVPTPSGTVATFAAWRALPLEGGEVLALRPLPLWPPPEDASSERARTVYRAAVTEFVGGRLGLDPAVVEAAVRVGADGAPYLPVVERFEPGSSAPPTLLGLAAPLEDGAAWPRTGPEALLGRAPPLPALEPLLRLDDGLEPPASVQGEGWTATPDGGFVRLATADGRSWRAAVGAPVWSDGGRLLARAGDRWILYELGPR